MLVVIHLDAGAGAGGATAADAERALAALAARPGYVRGSAGPAVDDPAAWILATEWERVGDYRRALGSFDVKMHATPLLSRALDLPSAFEQVLEVEPDGTVRRSASDRSDAQGRPR